VINYLLKQQFISVVTFLQDLSDFWHWVSECPDVKNYKWRLNPVWHRMVYSCTQTATMGVKGRIWRHSL